MFEMSRDFLAGLNEQILFFMLGPTFWEDVSWVESMYPVFIACQVELS